MEYSPKTALYIRENILEVVVNVTARDAENIVDNLASHSKLKSSDHIRQIGRLKVVFTFSLRVFSQKFQIVVQSKPVIR